MNLRRTSLVGAAIACAAVLLPAVALASSGTAGSSAASKTAAASRCTRGDLTAWLGEPGDGTAGSTYYQLELSNISHRTCTLYGFPGVSALSGGKQLGTAAKRSAGDPERIVTLAPRATTHVVLQITDTGVYSPSACKPATAQSLRVYPPGAYNSIVVPFSFRACAKHGPVVLHVTPVLAGTGIPGYSS
jgi:Domain of unknown function (DUF4232)